MYGGSLIGTISTEPGRALSAAKFGCTPPPQIVREALAFEWVGTLADV